MTPQRRAAERLGTALLVTAAGLLLLSWLLPVVWKYLSPFIIVLPFATMVQPSVRWLEKKLHLKRTPATLIPVLLFLLVVLALLIWFLSYGIGQLVSLLNNSSAVTADMIGALRRAVTGILDRADLLAPEDVTWLRGSLENALQWLATQATTLASYLLGESVNIAAGIPYALVYANFLFMGFYFIAKDYEKIARYFPNRRKNAVGEGESLRRLSTTGLQGAIGYLRVQVFYSLISLVVGFIFWRIMGNPYAAVIALLAATLELIPLLGNGAVYIPWAVIALLVSGYQAALPPLGLYLGLLGIRRLTEPKIMSQNMGVSPLLSLVGMFAGLRAGGILGLVAGPVLMTLLVALAREHYLASLWADVKTLARWLRQRWQLPEAETAPAEAAPPVQDPLPAEEKPEEKQEDRAAGGKKRPILPRGRRNRKSGEKHP